MTKNFSNNIQQKRVGAAPKTTGNGICKKPKAAKAAKRVWSPINKVPTRRRAASPTPMRINFEVPLRDELHPRACFKQPFVTVAMAMKTKRAEPTFEQYKAQLRAESMVNAFAGFKISEPTPTSSLVSATVAQASQVIEYIRVKNERAYICSACNAKVGEGSAMNTHAELVHKQTSWTRPGQPGRPVQDVHCEKYR